MTNEEIAVLKRKIELKWQLIRLTLEQIKDLEKQIESEVSNERTTDNGVSRKIQN